MIFRAELYALFNTYDFHSINFYKYAFNFFFEYLQNVHSFHATTVRHLDEKAASLRQHVRKKDSSPFIKNAANPRLAVFHVHGARSLTDA